MQPAPALKPSAAFQLPRSAARFPAAPRAACRHVSTPAQPRRLLPAAAVSCSTEQCTSGQHQSRLLIKQISISDRQATRLLSGLLAATVVISNSALPLAAAAETVPANVESPNAVHAHHGSHVLTSTSAAPPLNNHDHSQANTANDTPASRFHCTPITAAQRVGVYGDLGGYTHRTATQSPEAQKLIDQGLLHAYNYNQTEARASFKAALQYDPSSVAAHWGMAYALGPFMNKVAAPPPADGSYPVFTQEELEEGRQYIEQGQRLAQQQLAKARLQALLPTSSSSASSSKQLELLTRDAAFLDALAPTFKQNKPYGDGWAAAAQNYAQQLEAWSAAHPEDVDSLALAAEAWGNLQPWQFWDPADAAKPLQNTPHIISLLRTALKQQPDHPLAAHLIIHTTEQSTVQGAGEAVPAASQLPRYASMGHLVHMPSHTYLRVGNWHAAYTNNQQAWDDGIKHAAMCLDPDMPTHNAGVGLYGALGGAELAAAEKLATDMAAAAETFGPTYMSDGRERVALPMVRTRFAVWGPLLDLQPASTDMSNQGVMVPPESKEFSQAMAHYARGMADAAAAAGSKDAAAVTQWRAKAEAELAAMEAVIAALPPDPVTLPGPGLGVYSPGYKVTAAHAATVARARLAVLDSDWSAAEQLLRKAVSEEKTWGYTEPPRYYQPQVECLGWVLLQQGRLADAAEAYTQALEQSPRSPWPLTGLQQVHQAAAAQGVALPKNTPSLDQVASLLAEVKAESGGGVVQLHSSCPAFSVPYNIA